MRNVFRDIAQVFFNRWRSGSVEYAPPTLVTLCLDFLATRERELTHYMLDSLTARLVERLFTNIHVEHLDTIETWLLFVDAAPQTMSDHFPKYILQVATFDEAFARLNSVKRTSFPACVFVHLRFCGRIDPEHITALLSVPNITELDLRGSAWPRELDELDRAVKILFNAMWFGALHQVKCIRMPSTGPPYLREALRREWPPWLSHYQGPVSPKDREKWARCPNFDLGERYVLSIDVGYSADRYETRCYRRLLH